ncbi:MAG: hypothetical protein IPM58_15520 [Nitrospira sp.]|nr:hypothetical protein [Nitrospira sp.]
MIDARTIANALNWPARPPNQPTPVQTTLALMRRRAALLSVCRSAMLRDLLRRRTSHWTRQVATLIRDGIERCTETASDRRHRPTIYRISSASHDTSNHAGGRYQIPMDGSFAV